MAITGSVFQKQDELLGLIEVVDAGDYKVVKVSVEGLLAIKFPIKSTADTNEIELRTANILRQTALVDNPIRVEIIETP